MDRNMAQAHVPLLFDLSECWPPYAGKFRDGCMLCTVRLEKLQLEHTDFFLQRGVLRTQMGILHPHVTHAIRRPNTS